MSDLATDFTERLILDGTKVGWHQDRIEAWKRGERFSPITIDMALTRTCNYACNYCYATLQENQRHPITKDVITRFLDDCAELGVRGVSLVSDGESTLNKEFVYAIQYGASLGISMALGTNGYLLSEEKLEAILPSLTYLRINITAGEKARYAEIMGVKPEWFDTVCDNTRNMVRIKKEKNLSVTIGFQMVLMPEYGDQILPLARLGKELGPDYLVIKHCSDDEDGSLGVNYNGYEELYDKLREAEAMSTPTYQVTAKWSKIGDKGRRSYQRCHGAPFIIQISGSGLVAPCGMMFNEQYAKTHIGNICQESFKDMVRGDRYWEVMNYLASPHFNAQTSCGSLCLQHKTNEYLDQIKKGNPVPETSGEPPAHINFI